MIAKRRRKLKNHKLNKYRNGIQIVEIANKKLLGCQENFQEKNEKLNNEKHEQRIKQQQPNKTEPTKTSRNQQ